MHQINLDYLKKYRNPIVLAVYENYKSILTKKEILEVAPENTPNLETFLKIKQLILSKTENNLEKESEITEKSPQNSSLKMLESESLENFLKVVIATTSETLSDNYRELYFKMESIEPQLIILGKGENELEKLTEIFAFLNFNAFEAWIKIYKSVKNQTKLKILRFLKRRMVPCVQ